MFDRKKILIVIIILTIIAIAIGIILIILENNNKYKELDYQEQEYLDVINNPGKIIDGKKPQILKIDNLFFTVEQCIVRYYESVDNENKEAVYSILDEEYIKDNKISLDNVLNKIPQYEQMNNYKIKEIYVITGEKYSTFYVKTVLNEKEMYYIVNMDSSSKAYSVIPISKEIYNKKIDETIESDQQYEDTIELNEYNKITYIYLEEKEIVDKYLQDYLNNALFNPEVAYTSLNEAYKTTKYGKLENYKKYIEKNKKILESMCKKLRRTYEDFDSYKEYEKYFASVSKYGLDKYTIKNEEERKKIICIDTYGNYYIFNVKSIMNYELILDTYTIDLPEFTEKYETATTEERVMLNIQKIVEAINAKDYKYVYGKLADEFKANYFKTYEEFEKYAKNEFDIGNEVTFNRYTESENYSTYGITLKGKNKTITKTIVMRLDVGTNFVMSFNVN